MTASQCSPLSLTWSTKDTNQIPLYILSLYGWLVIVYVGRVRVLGLIFSSTRSSDFLISALQFWQHDCSHSLSSQTYYRHRNFYSHYLSNHLYTSFSLSSLYYHHCDRMYQLIMLWCQDILFITLNNYHPHHFKLCDVIWAKCVNRFSPFRSILAAMLKYRSKHQRLQSVEDDESVSDSRRAWLKCRKACPFFREPLSMMKVYTIMSFPIMYVIRN